MAAQRLDSDVRPFPHKRAKDIHAPGFYLSLQPEEAFAGAGIWHPDSAALRQIRDGLVARPGEWRDLVADPRFRSTFELEGDSLKRGPKGFDPDHPLIDDLKRKDFVAVTRFSEAEATGSDFFARYCECCRTAAPFVAFLTGVLSLEF